MGRRSKEILSRLLGVSAYDTWASTAPDLASRVSAEGGLAGHLQGLLGDGLHSGKKHNETCHGK